MEVQPVAQRQKRLIVVGSVLEDAPEGVESAVEAASEHIPFGQRMEEADVVGSAVEHGVGEFNHLVAVAAEAVEGEQFGIDCPLHPRIGVACQREKILVDVEVSLLKTPLLYLGEYRIEGHMVGQRLLQQPHLFEAVGTHCVGGDGASVGRRHLRPLLKHQVEQRRGRWPLSVGIGARGAPVEVAVVGAVRL